MHSAKTGYAMDSVSNKNQYPECRGISWSQPMVKSKEDTPKALTYCSEPS